MIRLSSTRRNICRRPHVAGSDNSRHSQRGATGRDTERSSSPAFPPGALDGAAVPREFARYLFEGAYRRAKSENVTRRAACN